MKLTILLTTILLLNGCASQARLPLRVTNKVMSDSGNCYLLMKDNSTQAVYFETEWDAKYCGYEVNQEIK